MEIKDPWETRATNKQSLEIEHVLSKEKSSKQQFEDNTEEIAEKIKQWQK